MSVAVIGTEG